VRRRDRGEPGNLRAVCGADAFRCDALNPYIGYDAAAEIVKEAASSGHSLREVARERGVDERSLDEALDYRAMAKPHGS
jgi:fumarate hydratase class II